MADYTVYPFTASGVAPLFIMIDREDDAAAAVAATHLLKAHASADRVSVWCEDRFIFSDPSAECATWLADAPERRAACPALNAPEQACPPDCGRFAGGRALSGMRPAVSPTAS